MVAANNKTWSKNEQQNSKQKAPKEPAPNPNPNPNFQIPNRLLDIHISKESRTQKLKNPNGIQIPNPCPKTSPKTSPTTLVKKIPPQKP